LIKKGIPYVTKKPSSNRGRTIRNTEMHKEILMMNAQLLKNQGWKINDIAAHLGKSERSVYYYLSSFPSKRKKRTYSSKLDNYTQFIDSILQDKPNINRELLFDKLKLQGYNGGISILRIYAAKKCGEIDRKAVIRFETEPGLQAQVDWKILGSHTINGFKKKLYAFVMVLGYSRMPYVCFTTSMQSSVFLDCHIKAFKYFNGVPQELLYDNMKTAWISDNEGIFRPNKRLLSFARHYNFIPKRCRIRRPQTKGKVERFIDYLSNNFWPQINTSNIVLEELNEKVLDWITTISDKNMRELNQTRLERYNKEKGVLQKPDIPDFDIREMHEVIVNRESFIQFENNKYSVPPLYIGKTLNILSSPVNDEVQIWFEGKLIRELRLERHLKGGKYYFGNDKELIYLAWKKQFEKPLKERRNIRKQAFVDIRSPMVYEKLINTGDSQWVI
jgi:transposase